MFQLSNYLRFLPCQSTYQNVNTKIFRIYGKLQKNFMESIKRKYWFYQITADFLINISGDLSQIKNQDVKSLNESVSRKPLIQCLNTNIDKLMITWFTVRESTDKVSGLGAAIKAKASVYAKNGLCRVFYQHRLVRQI